MAPSDVVNSVVTMTSDFLTYMLPIIGVLAGIMFVTSFFFSLVMGIGRRTFK